MHIKSKATFTMTDPIDSHVRYLYFFLSGTCLCMCLLQIVGIYFFVKLRGLTIIEKRYPQLVVLEAVVTSLNFAVVYPIWISYGYEYPISAEWWSYLCLILSGYTYQIAPIIETCRIWLISYNLHYLHSSQNRQWNLQIDASYAEKDWYLQNRGKWGNEKYVVRLGFIYYIVASTVTAALNIQMCLHDITMVGAVLYTSAVNGLFHLGSIPSIPEVLGAPYPLSYEL